MFVQRKRTSGILRIYYMRFMHDQNLLYVVNLFVCAFQLSD